MCDEDMNIFRMRKPSQSISMVMPKMSQGPHSKESEEVDDRFLHEIQEKIRHKRG